MRDRARKIKTGKKIRQKEIQTQIERDRSREEKRGSEGMKEIQLRRKEIKEREGEKEIERENKNERRETKS